MEADSQVRKFAMKFARYLFLFAGISGLLAVLPLYFLEARIGKEQPPAITHPEFYYGFLGVVAAWQVGFLFIARDPGRYRLLMIPAVIEKATYGAACVALHLGGRLSGPLLVAGSVDLALGVLFVVAFLRTAPSRNRMVGGE